MKDARENDKEIEKFLLQRIKRLNIERKTVIRRLDPKKCKGEKSTAISSSNGKEKSNTTKTK